MKTELFSMALLRNVGLALIAFVVVLGAEPTASAQGQWTQLFPTDFPPKRCDHEMVAFGPDEILLYGGEDMVGGWHYPDIWSWNGINWTKLSSPTFPPAGRSGHAMSYDPLRNRAVIFSGWNGGSYLGDTVEWNGKAWKRPAPASSPPGRDWAQLVFDPNIGKSLLFGGHDWNMGEFNDTWTWDGTDWVELLPANSPSPRATHSMVYDQNRGTVILIGGQGFGTNNEMWEWDGIDWTQLFPTTLPPRTSSAALVYDDARNVAILYGGTPGPGLVSNEVWEWDGIDWTLTSTTGPALAWIDAAYDASRQAMLVQCGSTTDDRTGVVDTTWVYGGPSTALLASDVDQISESTGGTANLTLDAGVAKANWKYLILGSVTGTDPGTVLPSGAVLPLNWDSFTDVVISLLNTGIFMDFFGTLDGSGQAAASFNVPPGTGVVGLKIYFAFALFKPWDITSNPVEIDMVP